MQISKNVLSVLAAAALLTACNNVDFKKTSGGLPYKIFSSGKGDSVKANSVIKFDVIQKIKDSVVYSSYKMGKSEFMQVQPPGTKVTYNDIRGNLMEILLRAREGDSIYITQSIDSMIKQNPEAAKDSLLKGADVMVTTLRVREVFKTTEEANAAITKDRVASAGNMEKETMERFRKDTMVQNRMARDNQTIETYLASKNIQTTKSPWGVYVQMINPGQGAKPAAGQFANVQYVGTTLAGKEFDKGVYPLQIGMGGSIKGFEDGIRQLGKGGRAKLFIPSMLGYGPQAQGDKIGAYEILVFDVEILDISDNPPAQQGQPAQPSAGADPHAGHGHQ